MLEELYIHNYRNFINCVITFNSDFTLLCGKNGTGKTTAIEVIHKLIGFITNGFSTSMVACEDDYPRWLNQDHGKLETEFKIKCRLKNDICTYKLIIEHNLRDKTCRIKNESLSCKDNELYEFKLGGDTQVMVHTDDGKTFDYPADWSFSGLSLASTKNSKIRMFIDYCKKFTAVSLDYNKEYKIKNNGKLEFTGDNFEKWYFEDSQNNLNIISSIVNAYKDFIPNLINVKRQNDKMTYVFTYKDLEYSLYHNELSSGQQRLCIYYYLLYTASDGSAIFIDEIENHLSPSELNPFYNLMLTFADEKKIQFIIVSHNPRLLNWYQNDAVLFTAEGDPAFVRAVKYAPRDTGISLYRQIEGD